MCEKCSTLTVYFENAYRCLHIRIKRNSRRILTGHSQSQDGYSKKVRNNMYIHLKP